jgi:hypothetical protein
LNNNSIISQKRRGLSSIVGALLFVVLMVATFAVLGVALDSQTDIVDTGRDVADIGLKKQQEKFVVDSVAQAPLDKLQIHLRNTGNNPTEIFTLVMTNSSDIENNYPTTTIDIPSDTSFLPPGTDDTTDILATSNLKMKAASAGETDKYQFKVISSLGTIEKFNLICDETGFCAQSLGGGGGSGDLAVQLFLDGPNGVNTKTSTIIMFVSNTGDGDIKEIWPDTICPTIPLFPTISPPGGLENFTDCDTTPAIDADPSCGDGSFKFDGTVSGDVGDKFTFCNSVTGKQLDDTPVSSNVDCDDLEVIDPNDCGGCDGGEGGDVFILLDDLLIRPSLFLTMPSPFGSTGQNSHENMGVWGVNVANPTNSTMEVSKVTITAFAPGANNNIEIFDGTGTQNENISPGATGSIGDWALGDENVMVWKNFTYPVLLPPYSNESFMLKVKPNVNSKNLEAIIVQASVFTTAGSFGKAAYQTTMFEGGGQENSPIPNVYLSTTENSRDSDHILGHIDNITNGTSQEFTIVFADMDEDSNTFVKSDAEFVINVPREWTNVIINNDKTSGVLEGPSEPSVTEHGDGSIQIIGTTIPNLGETTQTATITFNATAPNERNDRMYIMYVLGNGVTEDDLSVGPLSEIVLHVIGNSTGS